MMDRNRYLAAFALWTCVASSPASAQEAESTEETQDTSTSTNAAAATEAPRPIRAPDIVSEAEQVRTNLRRIEAGLDPVEEIQTIETGLPDAVSNLAALRSELDAADPDRVTVRPLEDHRGRWERFEQRFDAWMIPLESRWKELGDQREELRETQTRWTLTRDTATPEDFPPELMQRIEDIIETIAETEERLRRESEPIASLIERVTREQDAIADAFERLGVIEAQVGDRVLVRDAEPLWNVSSNSDSEQSVRASHAWIDSVISYADERPAPFLLHLIVFALLLLGSLALHRRSRTWPKDDPRFDTARFLASRPFALALAFGLLLMTWIYDAPPTALRDAGMLLIWIPILRLGSGLLSSVGRQLLYSSALLFLLDRVWRFSPDGSLFQRSLLLAATVLGLGFALWFLSRWRSPSLAGGGWPLARAGLYLPAAALAVSAVANIWGWSTLAQVITGATITSAYVAAGLLVLVKSVAGLIDGITGGGLGVTLRSGEEYQRQLKKAIMLVVGGMAVFMWVRRTLIEFRVYEPLTLRLEVMLSTTVSLGSLAISLGHLLTAVLILLLIPVVSRIVRYTLHEEILPRVGLPASTADTVATLANYGVITFGVLLAAAVAGFNTTQLTVVFGALGVGIGFGLQGVVNNFVSGLVLMFERPIKVGDLVETSQRMGHVVSIGLRASTIRTFDGADVIVPNGDLLSKEVVNWTLSDRIRRAEILVRVAYGSDPDKVLKILEHVAAEQAMVLETPAPSAQMLRFGESALEFRLFAWTGIENFLTVSSDLHKAVSAGLASEGIAIAVPRHEVRLSGPSEEGSTADSAKTGEVGRPSTRS